MTKLRPVANGIAPAATIEQGGRAMHREPSLDLTRRDAGSDNLVQVGDEIQVSLEENPGTGYRWEPDIDSRVLREVGDRYEVGASRPGAPGVRVKMFEAVAPGRTELRLVKQRSWETMPNDEFAAQIEIVP